MEKDIIRSSRACPQCGEVKSVGSFSQRSRLCKPCMSLYVRARTFGITIENLIILDHTEWCDSCGVNLVPGGARSSASRHIDHCHKTGRVRGVLCQGCNLAVGHVSDSSARLRALADYLDRGS